MSSPGNPRIYRERVLFLDHGGYRRLVGGGLGSRWKDKADASRLRREHLLRQLVSEDVYGCQ